MNKEIMRLYAVTDRSWTGEKTIFQQVEAAILGGVTLVQLREKHLNQEDFLKEAKEMKRLCHRYQVPLMINDNLEVALACGADGVHLGQGDLDAACVRRRVGDSLIIGITAKTVEQAVAAERAGADYLGSGAVFGTSTKLDAKPMEKEMLRAICKAVSIPVVAIGGINSENIAELSGTGISGAAIVSGIFAAKDIEAECRVLKRKIEGIVD